MLTPIILLIVFTLLNGFFSGSEMAFITANKEKLEKVISFLLSEEIIHLRNGKLSI